MLRPLPQSSLPVLCEFHRIHGLKRLAIRCDRSFRLLASLNGTLLLPEPYRPKRTNSDSTTRAGKGSAQLRQRNTR